jgi:arabinose-5-phosphate isomerase
MVIKQAIEVLRIEAEGILKVAERIDESFAEMVELICRSQGRLIISGIGKSGIVGRKIVGTLNSTGTKSLFLHPAEALHGDLGVVGRDDIFIALSNSGETAEINSLISNIQKIGCKIIAFTGNKTSTLAKNSNIVIDVAVEKEACPLGLTPTASTTALLAMGDALAVTLINKKHFNTTDFKESLVGIITDGDLRRLLAKKKSIFEIAVQDVMTKDPRKVSPHSPVYDALNMMEQYQITVLPVIDSEGKVMGILHLHDILGKKVLHKTL